MIYLIHWLMACFRCTNALKSRCEDRRQRRRPPTRPCWEPLSSLAEGAVSCSENRPFYGEILKLTNQSMGISLHRPYIGLIYGRYLQFRILEWPLNQYMISGWVCAQKSGILRYSYPNLSNIWQFRFRKWWFRGMGFWAALARQTQGLIGPHFTKRKSSPSQETKALLMPGMMSLAHASPWDQNTD